jgi:hypothetical protein
MLDLWLSREFDHTVTIEASALQRLRYLVAAALGLTACCLAACGGSSGASGGGSAPPPPPSPVGLSLYSNTDAVVRGGSVTLTWNSSNATNCTASGGWSGSVPVTGSQTLGPVQQDMSFSLACAGSAGVAPGIASVAIKTTPPPPPASSATLVYSDSGRTSLSYFTVDVTVNPMVWDGTHNLLHAVTGANSPSYPHSIVSIDPVAGKVKGSLALGAAANALAVSADGKYLYAGLSGGGGVQRVLAAGLVPDAQIPVTPSAGTTTSSVTQIAVSPLSSRTIAVLADGLVANGKGGLVIFDDAVRRTNVLEDVTYDLTTVSWSADASHIYAADINYYTMTLFAVTAQGVSAPQRLGWPSGASGHLYGNHLYTEIGRVVDLTPPAQLLGQFTDYGNPYGSRAELLANDKTFSVQPLNAMSGVVGLTISSFDASQFTTIDTLSFTGLTPSGPGTGGFGGPVAWGAHGLAVPTGTTPGLIVASGSFADSGGGAPASMFAPVLAGGTVNGTMGALQYEVYDISATDTVADSCGHVYVSISGTSPFLPNSIAAFDPATGTFTASAYAGSEPFNLTVSDDCSTLYAGLQYASGVSRFRLPSLTFDKTVPLGGDFLVADDFAYARSLSVAPGEPHTLAVVKEGFRDICYSTPLGLTIIDDLVERPMPYARDPNTSATVRSVVWGATTGTLYGEDRDHVSAFTADATGPHSPVALYSVAPNNAYDLGRDLYFDRGANRLYDSFGTVFDTAANRNIGPMPLDLPTSLNGGCNTPSAAKTTDSTNGKIFFVETIPGLGGIEIATYDRTTLKMIDKVQLDTSALRANVGVPLRAARISSNGLAFVTDGGFFVVLQGSILMP